MITIPITADSRFPVDRARIRKAITSTLLKYGVNQNTTVSISVVGDRKMTQLNEKYLKHQGTTDVISFPFQDPSSQAKQAAGFVDNPEEPLQLGDIIISFPQAVKQARGKNILVDQEVDNLVIHGLEHLLGHHHD